MSTPSSSHWHTISPQTRPLTLTILELTPLALTLSLSLTPSASAGHAHVLQQHVAHGHHAAGTTGKHRKKHKKKVTPGNASHSEEEEYDESDEPNFKDLLSQGVLVTVNGHRWNSVWAQIDGEEEEEYEEWEDEPDMAGVSSATGEEAEEGMTRRRPRKARFGSAAAEAAEGGRDAGRKKEERKERRDSARVVVYGLVPGKEYEVELRVVGPAGPDNELASNSVLIPPSPTPTLHPRSRANSLRSRSRPRSRSNSLTGPPHAGASPLAHTRSQEHVPTSDTLTQPSFHPSQHPLTLAGDTLTPTPVLNAVDTQAAQLRHLMGVALSEKEHLQSQIKEARRTTQRQEAALKAEIEAVKKAIEKAGGMDQRAKQKALAVQEQVKQALAGAESAEKEMGSVETGLGELEEKLRGLKVQVEEVQREYKGLKEAEETARDEEKKAKAEEDKKLADAVARVEKLKGKKAKKEAEGVELEKKLEELEKQREEAEKKNEEERATRRGTMSYYAAGYGQQGPAPGAHHELHDPPFGAAGGRSLSAHPSLSNLAGPYAAGPAYRPRAAPGGYQPRFPSGGARPSPAQQSPTHSNAFYSINHPVPPSTSPAVRAPKLAPGVGGVAAASGPSGRGAGVNAAALPFHPSNFVPAATGNGAANPAAGANSEQHTTLSGPHLQHRIYLPNVRPRPTPNFHPPPSVMAEQAKAAGSANASASNTGATPSVAASTPNSGTASTPNSNPGSPAFPPLPGASTSRSPVPAAGVQSGPSLASIVTRAVLSPTSALVQGQGKATVVPVGTGAPGAIGSGSTRASSPPHPSKSPTPPLGSTPTSTASGIPPAKRESYTDMQPTSPTWGPPGGPVSPGPGGHGLGGVSSGVAHSVLAGPIQAQGAAPQHVGLSMKEGMVISPVGGGSPWGGKDSLITGAILKKGAGGDN
ncbi:hypothetical protein IAT38_001943 [Cryptococcus sp. DSM 104549]